MGTLRIHGSIDTSQFWPHGSSDGDINSIQFEIKENSIEYKEDKQGGFSITDVFKDATSIGQVKKSVIYTKRGGNQTIQIRLQGVDTPVLFYMGAPLKKSNDVSNEKRTKFNSINQVVRQCFAESSTFAFVKHLDQYINDEGLIAAVFETNIENPFEAIDTYGRFVGNINVGKQHNINIWLLENGWGFPAFYTSMTIEEMKIFTDAWNKGKTKAERPGKAISKNVNDFNWELNYRQPASGRNFKIGDDKGEIIMPKIFRRQVSWMLYKKAGIIPPNTSFQSYLKKSPDQLILSEELLSQGIHSAKVYSLHDFISTENIILKNPEDLVFKEKPTTLVNSKGVKITKW